MASSGSHGSSHGAFGDTSATKVFVGGLAWETQRDTMRAHFEPFGDIIEAVVITDRVTGRSKGYGFVTFKDAEAARRACVDATPIIDGRRANCNLASLGQKHRQHPHSHGHPHHGQQQGQQGGHSQGQHQNHQQQQQQGPAAGGPGYTGFAAGGGQPAPYGAYPQQQFAYSPYGYPAQFPDGYAYPPSLYYSGAQQYGPGGLYGPSAVFAPPAFPAFAAAPPAAAAAYYAAAAQQPPQQQQPYHVAGQHQGAGGGARGVGGGVAGGQLPASLGSGSGQAQQYYGGGGSSDPPS